MPSPTVDGAVTGLFSGTNTGSISLTTTKTNDLIVVVFASETAALVTVASVTSASLLGFSKHGSIHLGGVGGATVNLEIWTAPSAAILTTESITVRLSGNIDDASWGAFGVNGLYDILDPFDSTFLGGPLSASDTSSVPAITYSTTQADDLILYCTGARDAFSPNADPSGSSAIIAQTNSGGGLFCTMRCGGFTVSTVQSAVSVTPGSSFRGVALLTALTGDPKTRPLQTFVTTICT